MSLLKVEHLNLEFHDQNNPETVVYDFNLTMEEGDVTGLVGESGSGKSLSAMTIAGLMGRHDLKIKGSIWMDEKDLLKISRKELRELQGNEIGIVFQEPMTSLNPVKRIGWQVEESLRLHTKDTPEEMKQKAMEALKKVGLEDTERIYQAYPHELSGGQRQRVMIAAAMILKPRLLIADEPTTALDVTIQAQIIALLKEINRTEHTAILFISHDLNLVKSLCDQVLVMQNGLVVEEGKATDIFAHPKEVYTQNLIKAIPDFTRKQELVSFEETTSVLTIEDLSVSFPKQQSSFFQKKELVPILKHIDLDIKKGEILGLVGESGSGKSTLARTILGMNQKYTGTITQYSEHPQMIFQDPYSSLNPAKKIGWILEEPLKNHTKLSKEERRKKTVAMMEKVGLEEKLLEHYPKELSGGQRQRVCIALALILEPSFLIADEPVSALDVTVQAQILDLLKRIHEEMGISILFISHDLRVVYQLCHRVIIMNQGEIVERGNIQEIYEHPKHAYTKELLQSAAY